MNQYPLSIAQFSTPADPLGSDQCPNRTRWVLVVHIRPESDDVILYDLNYAGSGPVADVRMKDPIRASLRSIPNFLSRAPFGAVNIRSFGCPQFAAMLRQCVLPRRGPNMLAMQQDWVRDVLAFLALREHPVYCPPSKHDMANFIQSNATRGR